jgi:regulator of replication initiation timing
VKLSQARKEINDLKLNYQLKCKENEALLKENNELRDMMGKGGSAAAKDNEVKKLQDEINRLRSLNKHRDDIIN